jgi:uncharacterized protein YjbI with pentapeptide repeats
MPSPAIKRDDELYQLLREENIKEFNVRRADGEPVDLRNCDFRGLDLRGLDVVNLDFSGSYFRQSDLRGINFSMACLKECSINGAKISGVYFPVELSPDEINMSLSHGTRMRYAK